MGGVCVFVQADRVVAAFFGTRGAERKCRLQLPPGAQQLRLEHRALGQREGLGQLVLNGVMAADTLAMTPTFLRLVGEGIDVGLDRRRKVNADCEGRGVYRYGAHIDRVSLTPGPQAPGSLAVWQSGKCSRGHRAMGLIGLGINF